jgi:hypothetical protein
VKRLADLRVRAHVISLRTGLFCIHHEGTAHTDPQSGLPHIKIEPAPGPNGAQVTVHALQADGWLHGTTALVKVAAPEAQVLITIYQQQGTVVAPQLHILQLSGDPDASGLPVPLTSPHRTPAPALIGHLQSVGDVGCGLGEWLGIHGSAQWIEGFQINPPDIVPEQIEYRAVLGRDWLSPWVSGRQFCGSRGMALPLLGFEVRLLGAAAETHACTYAATFVDGSRAGPVSAEPLMQAAADNPAMPALESMQVTIEPKSVIAMTTLRRRT